MCRKKILIATGGTGGHIFPAVGLADELQKKRGAKVLFIGGNLEKNSYFKTLGIPCVSVAAATFSYRKWWRLPKNGWSIVKGFCQSLFFLKKQAPDCVIGFGSFYTLPVLLAAKALAIPFILHEANSVPGKVNRLLSKYAAVTAVYMPKAAERLVGRVVEVAMPLRPGYGELSITKNAAKCALGLDPEKKTWLIFGGSQGARFINKLLEELIVLCEGLPVQDLQILHLTGDEATANRLRESYKRYKVTALVKHFEKRMDLAWQAADFALSRAGASTIAEAIAFLVPALLIPYPHSADSHQEGNGAFLQNTVGGGFCSLEKTTTPVMLRELLKKLFVHDGENLQIMQEAMQLYRSEKKTVDLWELIEEIGGRVQ